MFKQCDVHFETAFKADIEKIIDILKTILVNIPGYNQIGFSSPLKMEEVLILR